MEYIDCANDGEWFAYLDRTPILKGMTHRLTGRYWLPKHIPLQERPLKIIIVGGIGSGKTTLLESLGLNKEGCEPVGEWLDYLGVNVLVEGVRNNSEDASSTEMAIMATAMTRMNNPNICVMERSLIDGTAIFLHTGQLNEQKYSMEAVLVMFLITLVRWSNIYDIRIVYLECSPAVQLQRIRRRNFAHDATLQASFLIQVDELHRRFYPKIGLPCCTIDVTTKTPTEVNNIAHALMTTWLQEAPANQLVPVLQLSD